MSVIATVTQTITYVLIAFQVDMVAMTASARYQQSTNGQPTNILEFGIEGADLQALLAAAPSGATRGADVTNAIYQLAVAKGYINGTVT